MRNSCYFFTHSIIFEDSISQWKLKILFMNNFMKKGEVSSYLNRYNVFIFTFPFAVLFVRKFNFLLRWKLSELIYQYVRMSEFIGQKNGKYMQYNFVLFLYVNIFPNTKYLKWIDFEKYFCGATENYGSCSSSVLDLNTDYLWFLR